MVLVILETQDKSSTKFLKIIEKAIQKEIIKDEVIVQVGNATFSSKNTQIINSISTIGDLIDKSNLVIIQGREPLLTFALKKKKPVIVIPLSSNHQEVENDNYLEFIDKLEMQGYLIVLHEQDNFTTTYQEALSFKPRDYGCANQDTVSDSGVIDTNNSSRLLPPHHIDRKQTITIFLKNFVFIFSMLLSFYVVDIGLRININVIDFYDAYELLPNLLSFFWILSIISFLFLFSWRISKVLYNIVVIIFTLLSSAQYIYFNIFGKLFWLDDIKMVKEGLDYTQYIIDSLNAEFFMLLGSSIILIIFTNLLFPKRDKKKNKKTIVYATICIVLSQYSIHYLPNLLGDITEQDWNSFRNPRYIYDNFYDQNKVMQLGGFYDYIFRDFQISFLQNKEKKNKDTYEYLDEYFQGKQSNTKNDHTGLFANKNIIMVMIESGDDWMISEEYTPAIQYMMNNSINFTNYYAPIWGAGATFNSEFTAMTGTFSLTRGNAAYAFSKNMFPYSMPNVLKSMGYSARSYHFNNASFYNRGNIHAAIGFDEHYSFLDQGASWDEAAYDSYLMNNEQLSETLYQDTPFFDYFITYSAHLPYDESDSLCQENKNNLPDLWAGEESINYKCAETKINITDQFFQNLLEALDKKGILDDTVIIGYTDHYAYGYEDGDELQKLKNEMGDHELLERVPFFIYNHAYGLEEVNKVLNTSDVLPTVLNLFGKIPDKYYSGFDAFDPSYKGFVYFSDFSWYDGKYYYDFENDENSDYIQDMNSKITEIKDVNDKVLSSDYFRHINKR